MQQQIYKYRGKEIKRIRDLYFLNFPEPSVEKLALKLQRFEKEVWPEVQHLEIPHSGLNSFDQELFKLFKIGLEVPTSRSGVYNCLKNNSD